MSLVSEALKKAEREAAAREARARGETPALERPLQPYRARPRGSRPARAALVLGVLASILTVGWLAFLGGRSQAPGPRSAEAPAADAREIATQPAPPPVEPADSPVRAEVSADVHASAPARPAAEPPAAKASAAVPAPPTPSLPDGRPPQPVATPSLPETHPEAASAPAAAPQAQTKSRSPRDAGEFVRQAELPDGTRLELGGIVYSETQSFAYLNGRLVGEGEFVLGRRIERIDRYEVELAGADGPIRLRLKEP